MIDIPFSYYLYFKEEVKDYITLVLHEVVETIKGPVISSSRVILFYYFDNKVWCLDNIFELNLIPDNSIIEDGLDDLYSDNSVEISKSIFENLKEKFNVIIECGLNIDDDNEEEGYYEKAYRDVLNLIHTLRDYIKRIGLIK